MYLYNNTEITMLYPYHHLQVWWLKQNPADQSIPNEYASIYCQKMVESIEAPSPSTPSDPITQTGTISALLIVCSCVGKVNALRNRLATLIVMHCFQISLGVLTCHIYG